MEGEVEIEQKEQVEGGDGSSGQQPIPWIASPRHEDADQTKRRQTTENEPQRVEEKMRVTSVNKGGEEEDDAMGEPVGEMGRGKDEERINMEGDRGD